MSDDETLDLGHVRDAIPPQASLVVYAQDGARVLTLSDGETRIIGRTDDADVVIEERSLSRTHARIGVVDGVVKVEDLESKNGTKLNGSPIQAADVRPGDELVFGAVPAILLQPEAPSRWVGGGQRDPSEGGPIVKSPAMVALFETVDRFADANMPVLIQGETGAGKEVVARALHEQSERRKAPMACINCGAIPAQLVEDTLFGHERGAFTGAHDQSVGIFESASGGAVFLDEIGELPAPAQAALLRVLETKHITRVGSPKEISVDVRIIAATNRNLEQMCQDGAFRWDLLYRLNAVTLKVPPLRQRREEIPLLADHFLKAVDAPSRARGIAPGAMEILQSYTWPGNVRELTNIIQRAAVMAAGRSIEPEDLPERMRGAPVIVDTDDLSSAERSEEPPNDGLLLRIDKGDDFRTQLTNAEIQIIIHALQQAGWNQTEAATRLQMPLRTLVHKIKRLGIQGLISKKRSTGK